jgi:hypothetical protein
MPSDINNFIHRRFVEENGDEYADVKRTEWDFYWEGNNGLEHLQKVKKMVIWNRIQQWINLMF